MAVTSSGRLVNTPRRSLFSEMSRKNLSTMFRHDADVGVKCMLNRGCLASHSCTAGCLCVAQLSAIRCSVFPLGLRGRSCAGTSATRHGCVAAGIDQRSEASRIGSIKNRTLHQRLSVQRHAAFSDRAGKPGRRPRAGGPVPSGSRRRRPIPRQARHSAESSGRVLRR